jgi:isocitrate dehydrogenase kinase/phosphatase
MPLVEDIAQVILDGFNKHYRLFRELSAGAKERFERGDWASVREATQQRIGMYDTRVWEAVQELKKLFPADIRTEALWPDIKIHYIGLLYDHLQPECAETFFNSVACRVLDRRYYNNEYIFWRRAIATEHLDGDAPCYRSYYPKPGHLLRSFADVFQDLGLRNRYQNLSRDLRHVGIAIREHFGTSWKRHPNFQLQVLSSLFFRNKAAYVVGRAVNGSNIYPFVIPILRDDQGALYLDSILLERRHIGRVLSLARAYFMVDMDVPAAYVAFLQSMVPSKPKAELYTLLGLQKQGKTLLYRDLQWHLKHSTDRFTLAPGTRGMVMLVFTLPSFPFVFKIIRDWFERPKDTDAQTVAGKYVFVKYHDRVGRMADTLEYSDVAFPKERFEPELLAELKRLAPSKLEEEDGLLVIKHLYVERRLVPLDVFLQTAPEPQMRAVVRDYGNALRELAAADVFPGDLLLKNFGVTWHGR